MGLGGSSAGGGLRRRDLLVGTGALAVAAGCRRSEAQPQPVPPAGDGDWAAVRAQFALDRELIHFSAMFIASHPRPVREAIERHRRGLDESPARYLLEHNTRLRLEVIQEAARHIGASADHVALTDSTTMGLGLLYNGFRLRPGDEVLVEEPSYYSTVQSLRYALERSGAAVVRAPIFDEPALASAEEMTGRLLSRIGPRTRLVGLTWIHSDTGVKLPIASIARRLSEENRRRAPAERILLAVDGVHGLGVEDATLDDLGCDFFVAGTHKWVFGPRGTGVLCARDAAAWEHVRPTIPPFGVQTTPGLAMTPGGFHSFEMRWALADAFRFLRQVGQPRIAARTRELAGRLKEGLSGVDRVTVHTPLSPELSAGIVAFSVAGMEPRTVAARLFERGVVVTPSTYGRRSVRATPSIINTPEEVDRLVAEVAAL
jgi:selenocysteine lyase/cysteine desulfurase